MEENVKIVCPYCGSDDIYRDKANILRTVAGFIFGFMIQIRGHLLPRIPESNASYHCFDCHKDFNKPKIKHG